MAQAAILVEVVCECGTPLAAQGGALAITVKPCGVCLEKQWEAGKCYGATEVAHQKNDH